MKRILHFKRLPLFHLYRILSAAIVVILLTIAPALAAPNAEGSDASSLPEATGQCSNIITLTNEKAVTQLKEKGQYDSLSAAYQGARHAVQSVEAPSGDVLKAQNPGHGLSATFDRQGLQLSVRRHGAVGEVLTTRWRLASVGRGDVLDDVPAGDELRREGQRAEIVRAGLGLTEWFVNRPSGLEHGFTLDRRPAGEGALRLALAIEGDLTPVPSADGQRIELNDASGAKVLDYDKLRVWDATGKELQARMERDATGGLSFRVEDADARYPIIVDPTFTQQAYLKASNVGEGDNFGRSVAVSGDTVVIGAFSEDGDAASTAASPNDNAENAGAAYVFTRNGNTWTQQAYLKASNAGNDDGFGISVAVSGDTVIVGASSEAGDKASTAASPNDNQDRAGAAYVFTHNGNTWTQQAYLKASNAIALSKFGEFVAVSGDTVIVGSPGERGDAASTAANPNINAFEAGAAYVFTRNGDTWTQQAYLKAFNADISHNFGRSLAISGDTVIVGATTERGDAASTADSPNENASAAGAAYIYTRTGTSWTQQAYLKASNAGSFDFFGTSVAISDDTAIVSARAEAGDAASTAASPNDNFERAGAAYVFTRNGNTWTQQAYLKASNTETFDFFGLSVALSGETAIITAATEDGNAASTAASPNNGTSNAGAAYVFTRNGTAWTQQAYLKAPNAGIQDQFGTSVAISGNTVIIGAEGESGDAASTTANPNDNASKAGAAYIYEHLPPPPKPFRITEFIYVPTKIIEVTFNSVEGANYILQISRDLKLWTTLPGGPYPADVGSATTVNYPAGQAPPESLFFRVVRLAP